MATEPPPRQETQETRLADVLDRLAAALEQQAHSLDALTSEFRSLAGSVSLIETRLEALERRSSAAPAPAPTRASASAPTPAPAKDGRKKRAK